MTTPAFITTVDAANEQTKENEYTFKAVSKVLGKVNITRSFQDITAENSHANAILTLASQNVIDGFPDGTFKPGQYINRQQAVKLINRTFTFEKVYTYRGFTDVQETNGYYDDIVMLMKLGLLMVTEESSTVIILLLTRAQMAKMLVESLGVSTTPKSTYNPFVDTNGLWYEDYALVLYELGITRGRQKTTFSPNEKVTRQQFASFLYRALNLVLAAEKESNEQRDSEKPAEEKPPVQKPSHTTVDTPIDEFNEAIKNDPFYDIERDSFYAIESTYQNERFRRIITEGRSAVAQTSLKYTSVGLGFIVIEKDGAPNQVNVGANANNNISIHLDFKNEEAVDLARQFMKITYPNVDVDTIIEQRATEARLAYEKGKDVPFVKREFQGNGGIENIDGLQIKIGANVFLEFFWIEVRDMD
jgi:hypothetical protein